MNKLNQKEYQLCVILDHQYTTASFTENGKNALKSVDADRMRLLDAVNSRLPSQRQLAFYIWHVDLVVECYDTRVHSTNPLTWEECEHRMEFFW